MDIKQELKERANTGSPVKLTRNMTIADMIKALEPEIRKALPAVLTPERFTRMALSAINNTPKLAECTPMSFIAALMNAAQLGLEPNTPLGQAFLIPYKNKGVGECQFQLGYKRLINLAYRSGQVQMIQAQVVHENDMFDYELGLNPRLTHRPIAEDRGGITYFYAVFHTTSGGYNFSVMSRAEMELFAATFSKAYTSEFSPWKTSFEEMGKKTVLKQSLKYAPLKADFQRAVNTDGTIKTELAVDMSEIRSECLVDSVESDEAA